MLDNLTNWMRSRLAENPPGVDKATVAQCQGSTPSGPDSGPHPIAHNAPDIQGLIQPGAGVKPSAPAFHLFVKTRVR